jgi:hypothetical protein
MKIKILIVSFADWLIVAILAVFLCVAAAKSFIFKDTKLDEIKTEIDGYERKIKQAITSADVLPMPKTDYVAALRDRFEHMPVISPYQRNPFLPPKEIAYPLTQLKQKASRDIKLPGVRLMEQVSPVEEIAVKFNYNADEDYTKLSITAVHAGECTLRMRDDLEQVFRFPVRIRPVPQLPNPLPPVNVNILGRGPFDRVMPDKTFRREPAAVLIYFQPDNPSPMPMNVGNTTGAVVYRKPADSPDTVWRKLHKADWISIATIDQSRAALERFTADRRARPVAAPKPSVRTGGGPVVAEAAPEVPVGAPGGAPEGGMGAVLSIPVNSYVFLDEDVEEGESYLYKIDTVSTDPDAPPAFCKEPYISPSAVSIPSLVQMSLLSATPRSARIRLSRLDPEGADTLVEEVNVAPGSRIGGKIKKKVVTGVDAGGKQQVKEVTVDFSTNCVLVDSAPKVREVAYRLPLTLDRAGRPAFKVVKSEEPRIIYLTPRGYLRMKSKDEAPAATTPGGAAAPVAPGAPPMFPPGAPGRP